MVMDLSGRVIFGLYEAAKDAIKNCRRCMGIGSVYNDDYCYGDCEDCYKLRYAVKEIEKEFDKDRNRSKVEKTQKEEA